MVFSLNISISNHLLKDCDAITTTVMNINLLESGFRQFIKLEDSQETANVKEKTQIYDPEDLEQLEHLFDIAHPSWNCPSGNQLVFLCIDPKCKQESNLMCSINSCLYCQQVHENCEAMTRFKFITQKLQYILDKEKSLIIGMYKKEQEMIQKLRQFRRMEVERYRFGFLEKQFSDLAHQIYFEDQPEPNNLKILFQFYKSLKGVSSFEDTEGQKGRKALFEYEKKMRQKMFSMKQGRQKSLSLFRNLYKNNQVFKKEIKKSEASKNEKTEVYSEFEQSFSISQSKSSMNVNSFSSRTKREPRRRVTKQKRNIKHSAINISKEERLFIKKSLHNPSAINLLFRASEHNFQAKKFNEYCGTTPHTLTLVRTEFGKTIAGYTPVAWDQLHDSKKHFYVADQTKRSFLLSLDLREKMSLQEQEKAIVSAEGDGPIFGAGYDLCIRDRCNLEGEEFKSYARFPWSYNNDRKKYQRDNQEVWSAFCGASSGCNFRVEEYQVYEVKW